MPLWSSADDDGLAPERRIVEALEEALLIGRRARVPVPVSHHKISSASVFGLTRQTLARIDAARRAGVDVSLDQYPYGAGSGGVGLYVPQRSLAAEPALELAMEGLPHDRVPRDRFRSLCAATR